MTSVNVNTVEPRSTIEIPEWIYDSLMEYARHKGVETLDEAIMLLLINE